LKSDKPRRRERREYIRASQRTETFPEVCPFHIAAEQLHEMTGAEVNVQGGNDDLCERVQYEGG
jgi:hypothetical protein